MEALDTDQLSDLVHRLSDVELAILLCLVAEQHCILTTEEPCLEQVSREIELIASEGFGLPAAVVTCTADMTLDQFASSLLVESESQVSTLGASPAVQDSSESYFTFRRAHRARSASQSTVDPFAGRRIANVVVARDLHLANEQVQVQALELMRTKRFVTRKNAVAAPETFLFVAVLPKTTMRPALPVPLIDHFFISHYHPLEEESMAGQKQFEEQSDADSLASVVVRKPLPRPSYTLVPQAIVNMIRDALPEVSITTEVNRYLVDIVVFLRMHRAVVAGITPKATKDFQHLVKCLACLHGLDYATPALVALAVFKVYTHRIQLVQNPQDERSTLWGSSELAVREYLKDVDVESVIEDVLAAVTPPV